MYLLTPLIKKVVRVAGLIFLVPALLLLACSPPTQQLRVATIPWPGYESLHLAQSLGALDADQIRLVSLVNTSQIASALRNGSVAAGTVTLDSAITLISEGVDLQVILVMDFSHGADALLAKPGIVSLEALRGKRVAVENAAVGGVMLDATLAAAKLAPGDIEIIPLTVNQHLDAYQSGQVDAVVTFDPVRSELLALGAHSLFDSSKIPGRIVDVLAVRSELSDSYAPQLKALVAAHFRALDYMEREPRDSYTRIAPYLGLAVEQVEQQFAGIVIPSLGDNHRLLGDEAELNATARALAELMYKQQLLLGLPELGFIATARFLPDVRAQLERQP